MDSRKAWSCSQSGLLSRSVEIFTAALDIAENTQRKGDYYIHPKGQTRTVGVKYTNLVKMSGFVM